MTTSRILTPVPATPPRPPGLNLVTSSVLIGPADDTTNGRWTGGFAYAPENNYPAENRETCNETTFDDPAIPAPTGVTVTPVVGGGTMTAGTMTYQVTFVNGNGETTGSTAATATIAANGQATIAWTPATEVGVYAKVYGRVGGSLGLLQTLAAGVSTWTDTGSGTPGAAVPSTNTTGGSGSYGNLPLVTCLPWVVLVEDSCSSFGFEARDFIGRATRLCDNATPQAVESEFWTGALTQAAGSGNNYLTNPATVINLTPGGTSSSPGHTDGTPCSIARGIQILEDALASTGFGGQGMIHTMPETAPNFLGARRVGNQLLTVMDNIVVPGSGYTGTGPGLNGGSAPSSGCAWIYATDLVTVRLDTIQVFPDNFQEALDRGFSGQPNRIAFRAERFAAATWDVFRHFAVQVTLAT